LTTWGAGMLELQQFLIKEQVALFRKSSTYDILDAETREQVGVAREEVGGISKILRWVINWQLTPVSINVCESADDSLVFTIRRPVGLWRQRVSVYDADDRLIGYFQNRISWGGSFGVYDYHDELFAEINGDWLGRNYMFVTPDGRELGNVKRAAWPGLGLLMHAGIYIVTIDGDLEDQPIAKMLLLAAALAIDIVYYKPMR